MSRQYTNDLSTELLASIDRPAFSAEQLAEMDEATQALLQAQSDYNREHPVTAIWRHATVGSLTRKGGVVSSASSEGAIMTHSGEFAAMARVGDEVTYPDGSTARIVSGSGSAIECDGKGYALVGSHLSNGDEIISTPQGYGVLVCRAGETMPDDFLVPSLQPTA